MKKSKKSYDLCQDLIIEIFTRLPVKSLLRFRSVSKSLCACIGSPDFIRLHTLRSPEKVMIVHQFNHKGSVDYPNYIYTLHSVCQLLSSSPYTSVTAVDYPFTGFTIVGSSNGIICLSQSKNGFILWNPSTRRKLTVQQPPPCISQSEGRSLDCVFGFGYDPIIDDYKILRVTKPDTLDVYCFNFSYFMYTLKTDAWCEIRGPVAPYSYLNSCQCLFNGTLHWVAKCDFPAVLPHGVYFHGIITFDLSTNFFSTLLLPEPYWDTRQVTIIKGYLAVMSSESTNDNTRIWVRKEESWSVAFNIKTSEINRAQKVLQLTAGGDLLWRSFHDEIIVYNPATRVVSKLEKFRDSKRVHAMQMCVEGLGLLHMGTSC